LEVVVAVVPEVVVAVVPEVVVDVVDVMAVPDVSVELPVGIAEVAVVDEVSVVDIVPVVPVEAVSVVDIVLLVDEVSLAVAVSVLLVPDSFLQAKPKSAIATTVMRTRIFLFIPFPLSIDVRFVGNRWLSSVSRSACPTSFRILLN
jgi:hypothetical protein